MSEKSCEQLIDSELQRVAQILTSYMNAYHNGDEWFYEGNKELELPSFDQYALGFGYVEPNTFNDQPVGYYQYQMSYGGPSDELRFYPDGKIEYWYLDWFDGACRHVTNEDWARWVHDYFAELEMLNWTSVEAYEY